MSSSYFDRLEKRKKSKRNALLVFIVLNFVVSSITFFVWMVVLSILRGGVF